MAGREKKEDTNLLILNLVKQVKSIGFQMSQGIDETNLVHITGDETIFDFKTFTELVTAPGFRTPTGLNSEFLKADGSIDNTVYQLDLGYIPENIDNKGMPNGYASLDSVGLIPLSQIPPVALERLIVVSDQAARFALTVDIAQNGDTVKENDTGFLYLVKDDTNLGNANGYEIYRAADVLFKANIPVVLGGVKTLGKYTNGQTIPAMGKTAEEVLRDIALEYVQPVFSSFSISGQATTIEVGTNLFGSKTFTWGITLNSATVPTIDIYNNTLSSTLLAGTPNDGSQPITITSNQLNADGATQSWKGIGNNTNPPGTFNSGNFVVTARFIRAANPVAIYPSNVSDGAFNRTFMLGLPNAFKTPGANSFTMATGTLYNRFVVFLPPGVTITSVIDQTNANTDVTPNYILSTITINDAGGTARTYNMYQYTTAIPYTVSANHFITTN